MNELAQKCMKYNRNPLLKLEYPGTKMFIPEKSAEEKEQTENALDKLKEALEIIRVNKRSQRCICKYIQESNLTQALKTHGAVANFGYQNKNGKFLYPEESLFLLETNRVEVLWNNVSLSIQQAYNIFLKNISDLNNYRAYRKLMLCGFKLRRNAIKALRDDVEEPECKRQKLPEKFKDDVEEPECKRSKLSEKLDLEFNETMKFISDNAPKQIDNDVIGEPNYLMFLGESKKSEANFNLYISNTNSVDDCLQLKEDNVPNITAVTFPDSVAFYRFGNVNLPHI